MIDSIFRLADERTRELIRTATDQTLFLEAGAGTGKTRSLVDRVVALVAGGIPIDRIAAITFTDRAAAELRERVRTGLEERLIDGADDAGRLSSALESLDRAQISTIHAFCQAILRSFAAEAGVDPDFAVHDAVLTDRRRQEKWRTFLERLVEDGSAVEAVDRALSLGLTPGDLEGLAIQLANRAGLAEVLEVRPLSAPEPQWPVIEPLRDALKQAIEWNTDPTDRLRARLDPLLVLAETLLTVHGRDREATLAAFATSLRLDGWGVGNQACWLGHCSEVRDIGRATAKTLDDLLAALRSAALAQILPCIVRFVREDEDVRGLDGTLAFDDLILRVRGLLRQSAVARRSLRARYDALLIDEFQDTDPLQVEIAIAFAADPDTERLDHGRLFLVGDPKQSIYRFRRADMAVYANTKLKMEAEGATLADLALNKRSRAPLLGWVNAVFGDVIGGGANPQVQPTYRPIHTERDSDLSGPGVAWFGGKQDASARETRLIEARELASLCRQAIETEHWQVQERDGALREARFRDIAILIPRRTGLISLERALAEARIPYRVEGGSLIYRTQELRDLINCLTAIDDPADEVAIVAALRSPAFACSDVDLVRFKTAGGRFNYRSDSLDEHTSRAADALRVLREYHVRRHDTSLAALIEAFTAQCGQVEIGILDQGDRNSFRRVRFLAQQARTFESAGPESLRAFVTWLERQAGQQILDNEGAGVDDDEDAVRILTVHGAKGLEFPIVLLAGLAAAPNRSYEPYLRDHANQRVAVRAGTSGGNRLFTLGDYETLYNAEQAHERAEFDRILYVAATRARDHLVVSLHHGNRSRESAAQRLIAAGACDEAAELAIQPVATSDSARPFEGMALEIPDDPADGFQERRGALVTRAKRREYTSATAIKAAQAAPGEDDRLERDDETEPWSRGRAATRVGRAVHASIQSLPLNADGATIAAFARAQAVAEAVPHRRADVERLVRWVLRSEAWKRAVAAPRAMREVPFALEVGGKVLEGFIDLVIETLDGIEVVDWKTDSITPAQVDERMRDYELQAGLYVYGLQTATGRGVSRVTYVFAGPGVEKSPGEPSALAKAAIERLSAS